MSKCNYTAPDGSRSKVGEFLEAKYGEERTVQLWQQLNSEALLSIFDWKTDTQFNLPTGELQPLVAEYLLSSVLEDDFSVEVATEIATANILQKSVESTGKLPKGVENIPNTGLSVEQANEFIDILGPQIRFQSYVENKAATANQMFSFGLRWARNVPNMGEKSIQGQMIEPRPNRVRIQSKEGKTYGYFSTDQNHQPLPDISKLDPIKAFIQSQIGIDLSDYDAMLGNIYEGSSFIHQHRDTTESITAEKYPVVVLNLGSDGVLEYDENNSTYATYAKSGQLKLTNGGIYAFGVEGENRFTFHHRIGQGLQSKNPLKPIKLPDGRVLTDYRITLTFRRAADLTAGMPASPARLGVSTPTSAPIAAPAGTITQEELDAKKAAALNEILAEYSFPESAPRVVDDSVFAENLARMFAEKRGTDGSVLGYYTDVEQKAAVDSILTDVYASVRVSLANGENLTVGTLLNALKNTRLRIGIATKLATGERKGAIQQVVDSFDQLSGFALERLRAYGFNISDKVISRIAEYLKTTAPTGDINEIQETADNNKELITDEDTQETIAGSEARGMKDWNDVTFELNPRDTASKRLKFFLATIKDSELGTEDAPRTVNLHFSNEETRQQILDGNKRYTVRTGNEAANIKLDNSGRGSVQINGETFEVREAARINTAEDVERYTQVEGTAPEIGSVVYSLDRFSPKSNVPKNKLSYLGFPTLANFESLFEDLLGVLGDTERGWDNYRALLMGSKRPNMMRVAMELENSDEQLRNEFVKVMSKQYQPFTMVLFNQRTLPDGTKSMQARPINANRASAGAVILDAWKEAQKESEIIRRDEIGRLGVNTALANEFQEQLDKVLAYGLTKLDATQSIKLYQFGRRVLEANGIGLTDEMYDDLMQNMTRYTGKQSFAGDWKSQFRMTADGKPLGLFSTLIMKLSGRSSEVSDDTGLDIDADSFLKNNNPLYTENSVMKVLTNVALKYTEKLYSSSHRSSEGKSIYDWGLNTYQSHEIRKLKTDKNYLKLMQTVTFAKDSWLLQTLVNDPEARTRLQLGYLDGLKSRYRNAEGITRSEMSDREQNLTVLSMFQNTGYKYAHFVDMTKSDKTTTPVLMNVLKLSLKDGYANQKGLQDAFKDVFNSEFNRIREWSVNKANFNNAQYQKGGGLFYLMPHFNFTAMKGAVRNNLITQAELDSVWNSDGTISTSDDVVSRAEAIRKLNVNFVKQLRAKTLADWRRDGIASDNEHMFDESWVKKASKTLKITMTKNSDGARQPVVFEKDSVSGVMRPRVLSTKEYNNALASFAALEYSANYFLFNTSMAQLVSGDPALVYKPVKGGNDMANVTNTLKEYQKRLAKDIGPGSDPAWDINSKYSTVTLADFDYKSYLNNFGLSAYAEFDTSTDAQELTTTREHLAVMYAEGKIPVATYREMIDIIDAGIATSSKYYEFTKPEHLSIVMQPHKPVYVGAEIRDGVKQIHYVKSSSYPLLPQFTKGLQIDALRARMEGTALGTGYVARANFKSAKKIGAPVAPVNIFDSNGNLQVDALNSDGFSNSIQHLTRDGFRIQQEVPYDEEKEAIRTVSQMNKLISEGTLKIDGFQYRGNAYNGTQLRSIKENIRSKMMDLGKIAFLKKVGARETADGYEFDNVEKFYKALEQEAISRNYPTNDIEALRLRSKKDGRTQLVLPLWFNGSADRFESLAMALVRKIVEVKMPGKSFIQASSSGFKSLTAYEQLTEEQRSGITWASGYDTTRGLRSLDKAEDGSTKPAQVLVPFNFFGESGKLNIKDYVGEDGRIDPAKLPDELRHFIGARIPNQGHNSMLPIEIVGFIPDNMGDLMIVPAEITQQMGSDFDVDKLYVYKRAYKQNGNKLEVYAQAEDGTGDEMKDLKNQYFDIHWSVLTNPAMFEKILKPLDKPDLKNEKAFAEGIENKSGFSNYFDVQSQLADFQSQKDAKRLVGSSSLSTTFNALVQDKNLRLGYMDYAEDGAKEIPITIDFKDEATGKLLQLHRISGEGLAPYYENDNPTSAEQPLMRTKHDNITSQQSEFLDHAKNRTIDFLNINNHTYPASAAMSMLETDEGVALSLKFNSRLLQQEIIREYARNMAMGGDSLSTGNSANLKETVIADLYEKYGKLGDISETNRVPDIAFSPQELTEMLTTKTKNAEYYAKQLAALSIFNKLDNVGTKLVDIQGTLNQDTAGAGANLLYSLQQTERLKNLLNDDLIQGINEVAGNFIDDTILNPTTEAGVTYNSTVTVANELLTDILPYDKLTSLFDDLKSFSGMSSLSVDRQREVFKELKSFMFSANSLGLAVDTAAERARLLYDTEAGDSLAKRVQSAKRSWGRDNYLLQRLQTNIAEKAGDESVVQYNASKASTLDDYENIKAWISLLRSTDPIQKKLGEDLVSYVYLNGGIQNAVSFVKFVPISYLNATPFAENLRILNDTMNLENEVKRWGFIRQYFQHNPEKAVRLSPNLAELGLAATKGLEDTKVAPERFVLTPVGEGNNPAAKLIIRNPDRSSDAVAEIYPPFLSLSTPNGTKLYQRVDRFASNMSTEFVRIDTLGKGQISEYAYDASQPRSIFVDNRASIEPPKYLQTIQVEEAPTRMEAAVPADALPEMYEELGFEEGVTYDHIAEQLQSHPQVNKVHQTVLEIVRPIIDNDVAAFYQGEIELMFVPDTFKEDAENETTNGAYNVAEGRRQIWINANSVRTYQKLGQTMTHESVHAVTSIIIHAHENGYLSKKTEGAYDRLVELHRLAQESLPDNADENMKYAVSSVSEMVAHAFEDRWTQQFLNGLIDPAAPEKSIIEHIADALSRLIEAISEYIGIPVNQKSVLNSVIRESLGLMGYESTNEYSTVESTEEIAPIDQTKLSKYELFPGVYANSEQREAIDRVTSFVRDRTLGAGNRFVLSGAGGTGKTTIIKKIVGELIKNGYNPQNIAYSGLTHTAVQSLRRAVNDRSFNFSTIHSLLGIKKDERASMEQGRDVFKPSGMSTIDNYDVIIIDESSMLSDELDEILTSLTNGQKIIFMGDYAQLEPVGQDTDASPFRELLDDRDHSAVLIKNERTSHADIVDLLANYRTAVDKIRTGGRVTVQSVLPFAGRKDTKNITFSRGKEFMTDYLDKIKGAIESKDPYNTILVAYRNDRRLQINTAVRRALFGADAPRFVKGDMMIINSGYLLSKEQSKNIGQPMLYNMQRAIIESARETSINKVIVYEAAKGDKRSAQVKAEGWQMSINLGPDYDGAVLQVEYVDPIKLKEMTQMVYDKSNRTRPVELVSTGERMTYGQYLAYKDAINSQFLDTEYAYAVTSHKSQGMTYPYVFVEEQDIMSVGPASDKNKIKSLYTANSRVKEHLWIYNANNPVQVSDESIAALSGTPMDKMLQSYFPGQALPIQVSSAADFDVKKADIEERFPGISVSMVTGTGQNAGRAYYDFNMNIQQKKVTTTPANPTTETEKAITELEALKSALYEKLVVPTGAKLSVEERGKYEVLKQEIIRLENDISAIKTTRNLDSLEVVARGQLKWVDDTISNPDVTMNEIHTALVVANTWSNVFDEIYGVNFQGELPRNVVNLKGSAELKIKKIMGIAQRYWVDKGDVVSSFDDFGTSELGTNTATAQTRDLSRVKSRVGQEAAKLLQESHRRTREELSRMRKKFNKYNDKLQAIAAKKNKKVTEVYDTFFQKNTKGDAWGLVQKYSQDYYDFRKSTRDKLNAMLTAAESAPTAAIRKQMIKNAWDKYQGSVNQNLVFVNTTVFFDKTTGARLTGKAVDDAMAILVKHVGQSDADSMVARAERKYQDYLNNFEAYRLQTKAEANTDLNEFITQVTADKNLTQADREEQIRLFKADARTRYDLNLNIYENQHNPNSFFNRGSGKASNQKFRNYAAIIDAPKTTVFNGSFYDKNYEAVQQDEELKEIYNFIEESMAEFISYLPEHVTRDLGPNFLPIVQRKLGADLTSLTAMRGGVDESIKDTFSLEPGYADYANTTSTKIPIRYIKPGQLDKGDYERNIMVLLEKFGTMAYHYKHFSQVQSAVEVIQEIVNSNIDATSKGVTKLNTRVKNLSDMIRTAKEVLMYQQPKAAEFKLGRLYSTNPLEQKRQSSRVANIEREKAELDDKYALGELTAEDYNAQRAAFDVELDGIEYREIYGSKVGDAAIKLTELKALSYNPFSAIANLSFGMVSVLVHANGRLDFNKNDAMTAFSMMMGATKRAITFGTAESKTAEKILNLMDRLDIMGDLLDSDYGNFTRVKAAKDKWKQFISPYQMLRQSDYFVKGMTVVSMALSKKVTNPETGEQISLWEAMDDNANWRFGANPEWNSDNVEEQTDFRKFQNQAIAVTKTIMGNQDSASPMMIKRKVLGRLVAQFRASWMAEGAASRFEDERYDEQLGRDVKGRYRTYGDLGLFGSLLTLGRQALSTLVSIDPFTGKRKDGSVMSDVDIENMRKNLAEVAFFLGMAAAVLMLKYMGDDEDDPKKKKAMMMLINTLIRNRQDIAFYGSPEVFSSVTKNIIPAQKVWIDFERAMAGTGRYFVNQGLGHKPDDEFGFEQWALRMTKAGIPHPYLGLVNKLKLMAEKDLDTFTQ